MTDQSIPPRQEITAEDEGNLRELVSDQRFASVWKLFDNHLHAIAAHGLHNRHPSAKDQYDAVSGVAGSLRAHLHPAGDDAARPAQ